MQYLKIKSIKKIPTKDRYDLTVESTHNFFANGILIHNTSHISAYVLCKRPTKWWKFWDKVDTVYDYLYSSRSVIKNANYNPTKKQGYYGCDVWYYANEYLKPFLQKGMTLN